MRFIFTVILVWCITGILFGQADSIEQRYPFVKWKDNQLSGDSLALSRFFEKLKALKNGEEKTISVVHIGDSHLQADYFPGQLRMNLQKEFGNAGRGLIAPYRMARTNEPDNFRTSGSAAWRGRRIVSDKDTLTIGVSGLTVYSSAPDAFIKISVKNTNELDYSFNRVELFHRKGPGSFDLVVCDSLMCALADYKAEENQDSPFKSSFDLGAPQQEIILLNRGDTADTTKGTMVYGINLRNQQKGVLYHTIGINGAEYRHYLKNPLFFQQLTELSPDLVIISLGTNEAYHPRFNADTFALQVDSMIQRIIVFCPGADILLTTPGDALRARKYPNKNNKEAGKILIKMSEKYTLAYWDLFKVMGGNGSINTWFMKGLTSKDKLHLNRRGYQLQGEMMTRAILKAFYAYSG
jgi:lysophospholipase L1-like esterase